jgi:hypothetical protein
MRDVRIVRSHHQMATSNFKYGRSCSARNLLIESLEILSEAASSYKQTTLMPPRHGPAGRTLVVAIARLRPIQSADK